MRASLHGLMGVLFIAAILSITTPAWAQAASNDPDVASGEAVLPDPNPQIVIPVSSMCRPADFATRAHTNHWVRIGKRGDPQFPPGENPFSIRRVYGLPPFGGHGTIAIVSAFDYPTALKDFNVFARMWGLPQERSKDPTAPGNRVFQVVNARGATPPADAYWALESALDAQWAHAMAPQAKIVLVQAASNSFADLFQAVDVASTLPDVKQVSMSWGGSEFSAEQVFDHHMTTPGVVYLAAAGDIGGQTMYPSVSPNVVSAGGTRINRNARGRFLGETGWTAGGGGPSLFVPIPAFQAAVPAVAARCAGRRGTPDLAFDADPMSGVAIYTSTPFDGRSGWMVIGGTSLAAPALAGVLNLAHSINGFGPTSTADQLQRIYGSFARKPCLFRDIVSGTAGSFSCQPGWDFVTGVGSSLGWVGK